MKREIVVEHARCRALPYGVHRSSGEHLARDGRSDGA